MKTAIITTIFLSSITFFTGCSDKAPAPKVNKKLAKESSLSVYNIMGIKDPSEKKPFLTVQNNLPVNNYQPVVNDDIPIVDTIPIIKDSTPIVTIDSASIITMDDTPIITPVHQEYSNPIYSNNIEVVSYGSYKPTVIPNKYQNSSDLINNIEWNAKSFLGTRYVWGATGPTKFDCSGFTQWIYRDVGINIPRVSRDQAKVGQYISYNNLRKGDMVFFDTKKHRRGIVTHVGIYLGNGNFIHASSAAKKVVVYNFNKKPFYKRRFLWGRRVVSNSSYYASN